MNCRDLEKLLAEGRNLDSEAAKHISECARCRSLVEMLDSAMQPATDDFATDSLAGVLPAMTPVASLPPDSTLILLVSAIFLSFSLLLGAAGGLRGFHGLAPVERIVYYGIVALFGFLFSVAAVQTAIPGAKVRVSRVPVIFGSVTAVALGVTILFRNFSTDQFVERGLHCLQFGCICAALFGALAAFLLRQGYVTDRRATTVFMACFGGFSGVAALSLSCPLQDAAHIIVWHLGAVAVSALAGFAISSIFYRTA